jgi:adenylate cyclase class IV
MTEFELKSIVHDLPAARAAVERAGGRLVFEGLLADRRLDFADRSLRARDEVLRLRTYQAFPAGGGTGPAASLDWKGPSATAGPYKAREELTAAVADADALGTILARVGLSVIQEIDREIAQYELAGAVVRFERYPRLDDLVEVEGEPEAIERAIGASGLPRTGFTAERLLAFVRRYEERTGTRAAISDRELAAGGRPPDNVFGG